MKQAQSVNKVILVGTVGADPDVRKYGSGGLIAHLSLATTRFQREERTRTDWHRVTFHGPLAETVERTVRRGDRLYVEGRIEYGTYDRDGLSIPTADIVASEMVVLSSDYKEAP